MSNLLSQNITRLRKQQKYTQEELAQKLNVSFQAVSKWETGQSYPDISLLPDLAAVLDTDINSLMGYIYDKRKATLYDDVYKNNDYYWGIQPSYMCLQVLERMPPIKPLRLLDIGCGEGKDSVFFAKNGYNVTAFDITQAGVEKTKRLSELNNVDVNVFKANLLDFRLDTEFDIIFSNGVLHYIDPVLRDEIMSNYKANTALGGINIFNVFINKPFIPQAPDHESKAFSWKSGELFSYYTDWIITCDEIIFDCNSSGVPHKHCMDRMLSQRII